MLGKIPILGDTAGDTLAQNGKNQCDINGVVMVERDAIGIRPSVALH
jgi:hypothetical protein